MWKQKNPLRQNEVKKRFASLLLLVWTQGCYIGQKSRQPLLCDTITISEMARVFSTIPFSHFRFLSFYIHWDSGSHTYLMWE